MNYQKIKHEKQFVAIHYRADLPNSDSLRILTRSFLQEVRNPFQISLCDELAHALSTNAIYLKILWEHSKFEEVLYFALSSTPALISTP